MELAFLICLEKWGFSRLGCSGSGEYVSAVLTRGLFLRILCSESGLKKPGSRLLLP